MSSRDGPKRRFAAPAGRTTCAAPNSRREVDSTESTAQGNTGASVAASTVRALPWRRGMGQVARRRALGAREKASSRKPRLPVAIQSSCDGGEIRWEARHGCAMGAAPCACLFSAPHTRRCRYCLMRPRRERGQFLVSPSVWRVLPQLRHRPAPPSARWSR